MLVADWLQGEWLSVRLGMSLSPTLSSSAEPHRCCGHHNALSSSHAILILWTEENRRNFRRVRGIRRCAGREARECAPRF